MRGNGGGNGDGDAKISVEESRQALDLTVTRGIRAAADLAEATAGALAAHDARIRRLEQTIAELPPIPSLAVVEAPRPRETIVVGREWLIGVLRTLISYLEAEACAASMRGDRVHYSALAEQINQLRRGPPS